MLHVKLQPQRIKSIQFYSYYKYLVLHRYPFKSLLSKPFLKLLLSKSFSYAKDIFGQFESIAKEEGVSVRVCQNSVTDLASEASH